MPKSRIPIPYQNPWGLEGGLFGSVTIIIAIVFAFKAGWLQDATYIFFISAMIFLWGYLHSKTISMNNDLMKTSARDLDFMVAQSAQCVELFKETVEKQITIVKLKQKLAEYEVSHDKEST